MRCRCRCCRCCFSCRVCFVVSAACRVFPTKCPPWVLQRCDIFLAKGMLLWEVLAHCSPTKQNKTLRLELSLVGGGGGGRHKVHGTARFIAAIPMAFVAIFFLLCRVSLVSACLVSVCLVSVCLVSCLSVSLCLLVAVPLFFFSCFFYAVSDSHTNVISSTSVQYSTMLW